MDPTLKARTLAKIKDQITNMPPRAQKAAKHIVDNEAEFGLNSIRNTAQNAKVSTYTLVKLAKSLGFSSFEELRAPFRDALLATRGNTRISGSDALSEPKTRVQEIFHDASLNACSIVEASLSRQDSGQIERAAVALLNAKTVYITAVRSSYTMAYYLHYVGRMALPNMRLIPRMMNSAIDDLKDVGPDDVLIAITITPYSRETIEACRFAKEKGAKLLLITDSELVSSEFKPDFSLIASVLSTHNFACFVGIIAVIEALIAVLMDQGGKAAKNRIASYEKLRLEHNAYWFAQKKH